MERREKTEFLLEQMRLLVLVAKGKDAVTDSSNKDTLGSGGETDWIKVRVGGRKVNEGFLQEKGNEVRSVFHGTSVVSDKHLGLETEILRPHDPICSSRLRIPRCRKVLSQDLGDTLH